LKNDKVEVNGIRIAYTLGDAGKPLVLLHGYPLDRSIWNQLAPLLEDGFRVLMPDLKGFGESDVADTGKSIASYASDVAGVMKHVGMRNAYIVGHSMGGYVALAFAREYPESTTGIGLVSSQAAPDTPERRAGRYASAKRVLEEGVGPVAASMSEQLTSVPKLQQSLRDLISRQRAAGLAFALEAMADRPDSADFITSLGKPIVLVHGDADALIPVDRAREIKQAIPAAKYLELSACGHMPMLENPAAVAQALRFFLNPD
jgi:3-oxoadipate enol-lactonase